ncbi:hypothetical protein MMC20_003114 [Loxospora ochrophaea]|nr:hypothetical protein [Loxospora ochrophaea]
MNFKSAGRRETAMQPYPMRVVSSATDPIVSSVQQEYGDAQTSNQNRLLISSLQFPFNLTVNDLSSDDIPQHPQVFHTEFSLPRTNLSKRAGSVFRAVNSCPTGASFYKSFCEPPSAYRPWALLCLREHRAGFILVRGQCAEDEICFTLVEEVGSAQAAVLSNTVRAYCVSVPNPPESSPVDPKALPGGLDPNPVDLPNLFGFAEKGSLRSVRATVTSGDQHTCLTTSHIQVAAQRERELFGAQSWTTLDGGLAACEDCCAVELSAVPAQASRFVWSIALNKASAGVQLFLSGVTIG